MRSHTKPYTIAGVGLAALLTGCAAFGQSAPVALAGTEWTLAGMPGRVLVPGSSVSLQFTANGVAGSDGCNRYFGGYTASGATLEVSQLAATQMACAAELMTQGRAFTGALTEARGYRISAGTLTLLGHDGTVLATLAAQARELAGTSWSATGINNGKQAVASVVQGSTISLDFGADGRASGTGGCNRYMAQYTQTGANLKFAPAAATRRMCVMPDVMKQEQAYFAALESVATAEIDGDKLVLRTASGAIAASFTRAAAQ